MTSRFKFERWCFVLGLMLIGCGKSPVLPSCPEGFAVSPDGDCFCESSGVCPQGLTCVEGTCRCVDDECCPEGYVFDSQTAEHPDRCVCQGPECCPEGTRYDDVNEACVCANSECCPENHAYDEALEACACRGDTCCPEGFVFNAQTLQCDCASDACCPVGYRFDVPGGGCTCANDGCCPSEHVYSAQVQACVCTGVGCCPAGFEQRPDGSCACAEDSACPPGLSCQPESGRCVCVAHADCGSNAFCNSFGSCQALVGCGSNLDCPSGTFCFAEEARCLPEGVCAADVNCPIGQVCDLTAGACRGGCHTTADCVVGDVCIDGNCESGRCEDSSLCPLRSSCDPVTQRCLAPDFNQCRSCEQGCGNEPCVGSIVEGGANAGVCAVDCAGEDECPGGMVCSDVFYQCTAGSGFCESQGAVCVLTEVLNGVPTEYCSDPVTRVPTPLRRVCAPRTGVCE